MTDMCVFTFSAAILINLGEIPTVEANGRMSFYAFLVQPSAVDMAHNETSLMKLKKGDLVWITLGYQGKFNNILDDLKKDISDLKSNLSGLKSDFSKLEADIQVTRNENSKLSGRLVTMGRTCYAHEQYSRRECLKILSIPASIADKDLESKVFEILEETDVPIDPTLV